MSGNRQSVRRTTVLYLKVIDEETEQELGRLADLSHQGALIVAPEPFDRQREYHIRVVLPASGMGGLTHIEGTLEPRWSRPDRNPGLTLNGCILSVAPEHRPVVELLIDRYGFSDGTIDFRRKHDARFTEREKEMQDG